jgi:hypothetical protein
MYMTASEPAISLYSGTLGAFLLSHGEQNAVPREPVLSQLREAISWLQENNSFDSTLRIWVRAD